MKVLVTGGAGYIGSVVSEELLNQGYQVITLDNLSQGHREAVLPEAEFVQGDLRDPKTLDELFQRFKIDAVMHMAAETVIKYSLTDPKRYFQNNVIGGINLLDIMLKHQVDKIIFSSSAAVYGEPQSIPIEENHPKNPINAYGESKLIFEHILEWYGKAYGIKHISLRYFNAAGATELLGEVRCPETHLIPNVLKAALDNSPVSIFGADYPTKDGSCIRDYIHVVDIARAHILALEKLCEPKKLRYSKAYNLGNGVGFSVIEVIEAARKVIGSNFPVKLSPRRPGDPTVLVASSKKAEMELGWKPELSNLEYIIKSAWRWKRKYPKGYSQGI